MAIDPGTDARTARIAERHFGYITRDQAYAAGHSERSLKDRGRAGRLERVNVRLFRAPGAPRSWQGDAYAATAGCPPGAVAAAMTAAALFGAGRPPLVPHIVVPRGATPRGVAAVVHQWRLDPADRTRIGVIPVTTPARSLVDCARLLTGEPLQEVVDALFTARLVTHDKVLASLDRSGLVDAQAAELLQLLVVWRPGIEHDSVPEARMFRLILGWGLPMPTSLHLIVDDDGEPVCEVDAAWVEDKVALDYDSKLHHGPRRWPKDELRAARARALGWRFVPVDCDDLAPGGQARFRAELEGLLRRAA